MRKEQERLAALCRYERACVSGGMSPVAGMDEVGRGSLAGPVLACAVVLPAQWIAEGGETLLLALQGVDDSKKLSPAKRERFCEVIREAALGVGIGTADAETVDVINILRATHKAMAMAMDDLSRTIQPEVVLIDGRPVPGLAVAQEAIPGGDRKSVSVAAASIVAKVTRDQMMREYHALYPAYGFDAHKGYGTKRHMDALREHGLCPIHRRSFCTGVMQ